MLKNYKYHTRLIHRSGVIMADAGKPDEAQAKKAQKPDAGRYDTSPEDETIARVKEILDGLANPNISLPPSKVILLPENAQSPSEDRKMPPEQEPRPLSEQEARPIIIEQGRRSDGLPQPPPLRRPDVQVDQDLIEDERGLRAAPPRPERSAEERAQRPIAQRPERTPEEFLKERSLATRPPRMEQRMERGEPRVERLEPRIERVEPRIERAEPRIERVEPRMEPRPRPESEPSRRSPPTFASEIPRHSFAREEREVMAESKKNYAPAVPGVASVNLYRCPQCGGFVNPTVSPTCYNCGYTIHL